MTRQTSRRRRAGALHLEALEDRETPAVVGALDPSFGAGGVTATAANHRFAGVALQQDGKIVAVSELDPADFYVTRYNPDGSLDTTFGSGGTGVVTVDVGGAGQFDSSTGVAVDAQNRIVVVGYGGAPAAVSDFAVVRLSADGKTVELNTHFHLGNAASQNFARAVAFQSDGTIVVAGDALVGATRDFEVARVNPTTGAVINSRGFGFGAGTTETGRAVTVYPTGPNVDKIVVAGTTSTGAGSNIGVAQFLADLSAADVGFNGTGGKSIDASGNDTGSGVAVTPTGSVVVTGTNGAADPDMVAAQLLPTGGFDPAFGGGALKTITRTGGDYNGAVAVQADGKIVLAGGASNFHAVGLVRLNPDGSPDMSFNWTGDASFPLSGTVDSGNAVTVTPEGRVVVAGERNLSDGFVARLIGSVEKGERLAVGGGTTAVAQVFTPVTTTGQYGSPSAATPAVFGTVTTDARVAVGDVNGDGVPDTALVTGPGTPVRFAVVSGADGVTLLVPPTDPFGGGFTGGGFVAVGDLDNDGRAEVVVTPDQGGGPRVTVFSLRPDGTLADRASFLGIDDANFRGGARAALGDVDGDGVADLAVAAGFLGGPRVALFDGGTVFATPTRLINDFFAFPGTDATNLRNGAYVAAGDVDGDGKADLIFGGGPGGAPRVFVLGGALVSAGNVSGAQAAPVANFFVAGNDADRGGVRVAAADADRDGRAEVVAGSGEGVASRVRVYLGKAFTTSAEPATFQDLDPYGAVLPGGVFVG